MAIYRPVMPVATRRTVGDLPAPRHGPIRNERFLVNPAAKRNIHNESGWTRARVPSGAIVTSATGERLVILEKIATPLGAFIIERDAIDAGNGRIQLIGSQPFIRRRRVVSEATLENPSAGKHESAAFLPPAEIVVEPEGCDTITVNGRQAHTTGDGYEFLEEDPLEEVVEEAGYENPKDFLDDFVSGGPY